MIKLALLRHGQSIWNREKRFTGWTDVELSDQGAIQAEHAGRLLAAHGYAFDLCFTSCLRRAIDTLRIVLGTMGLEGIPVRESWCLNERHYGALQGLSWWEAVRKYGLRRLLRLRRRFALPPPQIDSSDPRFPGHDPRYAALSGVTLPCGESLRDTQMRVLPYWQEAIVPELRRGKCVLVVAHHNTLRAIVKHLDDIADGDVVRVRIPTAQPIVYELDDEVKAVRHYYLKGSRRLWRWTAETLP